MKKFLLLAIIITAPLIGGCLMDNNTDPQERGPVTSTVSPAEVAAAKKAEETANKLTDAVDKADVVVSALEQVTNKHLSESVVNTGNKIATTGQRTAGMIAGISTMLGHPEVGASLLALSGLFGGIAGFFRRRKNKYRNTLVAVGNATKGGGAIVSSLASRNGVGDEVEAAYNSSKKYG